RRDEMAVRQDCRLAGIDLRRTDHAPRRHRHQTRQQGPGALQAEALRLQQRTHRNLQVPFDVCRSGGFNREQAGDSGRFPGDACRPFHPQDQPRRAAAALQRRVRRQPVAGRATSARLARQGRKPPLRRGGRRLFCPPPRQTRHHRLGTDPRLARRNRQPGKNPTPRRTRPVLHRELVDLARPLHPGANPVRADPHGERLLSELRSPAAALADGENSGAAAVLPQRLLNIVLFVTVLASSLAFIEPSPHDGLMIALLFICVGARVPFDRKLAPLVLLLTIWLVGGCLSLIQVGDQQQTIQYVATSFYLALAEIMFACLFCDGDLVRLTILRRGYILAALIATAAGYVGFFHLLPGSDIFLAYDRVSATFKDPNVYGPFLIFPLLLLLIGV